jgi:transposase
MASDARDQRIAELETLLAQALQTIEQLRTRVGELEAQLKKNSTNSSKPPSSDGPEVERPAPKARGKKRGGQTGHDPHLRDLRPAEECRKVIAYQPKRCLCGSANLSELKLRARHQIVYLPKLVAPVDEHQSFGCTCLDCGAEVVAPIPPEFLCSAFGACVVALIGQLTGEYHLPKRKVVAILSDLFGIDLSLGAVCDQEQTIARAVEQPVAEAHAAAQQAAVGNADETGWRENKKRAWLWVLVTRVATVFTIAASRGGDAAKALLGEGFPGTLTTDRWVSYGAVGARFRQLCWAHLIRDLLGWVEVGGDGALFAAELLKLSKKMFRWWSQLKDRELSRAEFQRRMARVRCEMLELLEAAEVCPETKVAGMAREILKLRDALFTFVDIPGVEPTNNAAERAIRHAAIWRKICFGTDSVRGSRYVERVLTVVATLKLQQRPVRAYLAEAVFALRNGLPSPALLPG